MLPIMLVIIIPLSLVQILTAMVILYSIKLMHQWLINLHTPLIKWKETIAAVIWNKVDDSQAQCGSCHGLPPTGHVDFGGLDDLC